MRSIPSDAELAILTLLWRCGPSTGREVHETQAKDTGYTSTLKQMQVMYEKGLLRRVERYRSHVYEAAASREEPRTFRVLRLHSATRRQDNAQLSVLAV